MGRRLAVALFFVCVTIISSEFCSADSSSLNKQIVEQHLNHAKSFIHHAQRTRDISSPQSNPADSNLCTDTFADSLNLIKDAHSEASLQNWQDAKTNVAAALDKNTECIQSLSHHKSPLARSLWFLAGEISTHLKAAVNELDITTNTLSFEKLLEASFDEIVGAELAETDTGSHDSPVEPNRIGCSKSQVDGTKCQFSECGKDYGLVTCAIGFAQGVKGGLYGQPYVVTSDIDNPLNPVPGTLRYGVNLARSVKGGVWITFARSMLITLTDMLWVQSYTTIDGRGVNATLVGRNVVLGGVTDVIIHNIQINNIRGSDTLHIFSGTTKVWIDHLTSFAGELGLASVLQGSTDVTISNSNLQNYNFNMLLGASDADWEDKDMRVTVYRNWFHDSMQRMPHCRWGTCHVVNNYYTNWGYYAIGARANARVKSESNVFIASRVKEVTPWYASKPATFDMSSRIESHNDVFLNGTTFHQFLIVSLDVTPPYTINNSPPVLDTSSLPSLVQACAGALFGANVLRCQNV